MKAILLTVALWSTTACAQHAPVTRTEFAEFFAYIARGYTNTDVLTTFAKDQEPVTRDEVAGVMLALARAVGKAADGQGSALRQLAAAGILLPTSTLVTHPGSNFRPQDLVLAVANFTEGMAKADHKEQP